MKLHQRIINTAITINGTAAGVVLLGSIAVCAGTTALWFATSPFVPDRVERQIARPILPAAASAIGGLLWGIASIPIALKWRKDDDELVSLIPRVPQAEYEQWSKPSQPVARCCMKCRYYSKDVFLLPCAVHPGCSKTDAISCRDFEPTYLAECLGGRQS